MLHVNILISRLRWHHFLRRKFRVQISMQRQAFFMGFLRLLQMLGHSPGLRTPTFVYRVSREECARLRENVPLIKIHPYNPKHLYPKLNGYRDNGERSVVFLRVHVLYLVRVTYYPYTAHVRRSVYSPLKLIHAVSAHVKFLEP